MAKSKKITKDSTKTTTTTKNVFDEFIDMKSLKTQITSELWAEKVASELINWAENDPEAFKVNEFWRKYGVHREDAIRLMERYPILKKAYEYALMILGDKREKGAAHVGDRRLWDPGVVMRSLERYDPDLKEYAEWKAKLNDEVLNTGAKIIVMPQYPKTDIVPERK